MITVTGSVKDIFGSNASVASVSFRLCGYGTQIPVVSGTGIIAGTSPTASAVSSGSFSVSLYGQDVITPSSTYYSVQFLDSYNNPLFTVAYQFTGSGTIDLSVATPYNAPPSNPLSGFYQSFSYTGNASLPNVAHPIIAYGTGGTNGIVLTLPVASLSLQAPITLKKADSAVGTVYFGVQGSDKIDGQANLALTSQYKYATVLGSASYGWSVIASN